MNQSLFYWINGTMSHPILDWLLPRITDLHKETVFVSFILPGLLLFCFYKARLKVLPLLFFLILTIGAVDNVTYRVLKPYFKHPRPPAVETQINIRTDRYAGYGFPSNHAANMFAGATFLSLVQPLLTPVVYGLAFIIAYSRVYVGVHYPLDVFVGGGLGVIFGLFFFKLYEIILLRFGLGALLFRRQKT